MRGLPPYILLWMIAFCKCETDKTFDEDTPAYSQTSHNFVVRNEYFLTLLRFSKHFLSDLKWYYSKGLFLHWELHKHCASVLKEHQTVQSRCLEEGIPGTQECDSSGPNPNNIRAGLCVSMFLQVRSILHQLQVGWLLLLYVSFVNIKPLNTVNNSFNKL